MKLDDPRRAPAFVVRVLDGQGGGGSALAAALLELPAATDEDVARMQVLDGDEEPTIRADAVVLAVRGEPTEATRAQVKELSETARVVLAFLQSPAGSSATQDDVRTAWGRVLEPEHVFPTRAAEAGGGRGVDELRAAILQRALDSLEVPVARARLAKRPYAVAIVGGATLVAAGEGLLPGAAALVVATQVGAIASLYYLYTGRWLARSQALAILPAFASEAAGGSLFLLAKSFLPPTGIADAAAAIVAASITLSALGAIAWALEKGHSLQQTHDLALAFKRMKAKTRAERARITRSRHRWKDREFWEDMVRRIVFD